MPQQLITCLYFVVVCRCFSTLGPKTTNYEEKREFKQTQTNVIHLQAYHLNTRPNQLTYLSSTYKPNALVPSEISSLTICHLTSLTPYNQHTRELISAPKMSYKYNTKDLSRLQ